MSQDFVLLAETIFKLKTPFSKEELQSAYREAAKKTHPDTLSITATKEQVEAKTSAFRKIKEIYDFLLDFVDENKSKNELKINDGTLLSELGKGLGQFKNGVECSICEHRGYNTTTSQVLVQCKGCSGTGRSPTFCRSCNGTGKFTQRRSLKVVSCLTCKGSGFTPSFSGMCWKCFGTGSIPTSEKIKKYHRCSNCSGTGEILIRNPVLTKGVLGR